MIIILVITRLEPKTIKKQIFSSQTFIACYLYIVDALDPNTVALLPSQQEEEKWVMGYSNFHALILVN